LLVLLTLLSLLFLVHWGLFFWAESRSTDGCTWEEALWQTWQTFTTVGYGNRPAGTTLGRWVTMLFSTAGIAVLGTVFAAVFDLHLYLKDLRRAGLIENPLDDFYCLIHYPGEEDLRTFLEELRNEEPKASVCLIDESLEALPPAIEPMKPIHFIRGSAIDRAVLDRSRVERARVVIVFPPEGSSSGADAMTKTIISVLSNRVDLEKTRLMHVLQSADNAWMFKNEPSTAVFKKLDILAVVQECHDPYSAQIAERMLRNSQGANIQTVPAMAAKGLTWGEFNQSLFRSDRAQQQRINPLALIRNGEVNTCPDTNETIQEGDWIAFMSPHNVLLSELLTR
jgi:voltage-gated potassium channel Kch